MFPQKTLSEGDLDSKSNYPYRYENLGFSTAGQLGENVEPGTVEGSKKSLQRRKVEAPGVWVLLEMRLSGSSSSSSPLSSGMASSGMACIWTPGAWGSIRRFSNSRCLWPMVQRLGWALVRDQLELEMFN